MTYGLEGRCSIQLSYWRVECASAYVTGGSGERKFKLKFRT